MTTSAPVHVDDEVKLESFCRASHELADRAVRAMREPSPSSESLQHIHLETSAPSHGFSPKKAVNETLDLATQLCGEINLDVTRDSLSNDNEKREKYIDLLTGTWLVLYFLGVPFVEPWEAVLRLIERAGTLTGASCSKATGDIYRAARRQFNPKNGAKSVIILDRNPIMYGTDSVRAAPRAMQGREPTSRGVEIRRSVAALGRCYEMIQFRWYTRTGAPLRYCVTASELKPLAAQRALFSSTMQSLLAGGEPSDVQSPRERCLVARRVDPAWPTRPVTCVLGRDLGIDRGDTAPGATSATTFIAGRQLEEYRRALSVDHEADLQLTGVGEQDVGKFLTSLRQ